MSDIHHAYVRPRMQDAVEGRHYLSVCMNYTGCRSSPAFRDSVAVCLLNLVKTISSNNASRKVGRTCNMDKCIGETMIIMTCESWLSGLVHAQSTFWACGTSIPLIGTHIMCPRFRDRQPASHLSGQTWATRINKYDSRSSNFELE